MNTKPNTKASGKKSASAYEIRDARKGLNEALFSGKGRWLFTILTVVGIGGIILLFTDEEPTIYFPFTLKGKIVLWILSFVSLFWFALAIYNWIV